MRNFAIDGLIIMNAQRIFVENNLLKFLENVHIID